MDAKLMEENYFAAWLLIGMCHGGITEALRHGKEQGATKGLETLENVLNKLETALNEIYNHTLEQESKKC